MNGRTVKRYGNPLEKVIALQNVDLPASLRTAQLLSRPEPCYLPVVAVSKWLDQVFSVWDNNGIWAYFTPNRWHKSAAWRGSRIGAYFGIVGGDTQKDVLTKDVFLLTILPVLLMHTTEMSCPDASLCNHRRPRPLDPAAPSSSLPVRIRHEREGGGVQKRVSCAGMLLAQRNGLKYRGKASTRRLAENIERPHVAYL